MYIKMLTTTAGPDGVFQSGEISVVPDKFARALIAAGSALPVDENRPETATAEAPENAAMPAAKKRKKR